MHDAIKVERLSKLYRIASNPGAYRTLRESLAEAVGAPWRGFRARWQSGRPVDDTIAPGSKKDFWALKDVSFEIGQGEVVGIIGRNGAGKSTLLKILSRITEPTSGRAEIRGRVGSLLEVGTGFHPELTGRENIYLNGSILGMSRREIASRFDEIVSFSEVERFLDTPVKRYSSGMHVRLAFAVAAHLEPEILIIDEVLAVGDAQFQRKCLGKMEDMSRDGRTVFFVSHAMNAVRRLCSHVIFLESGRVKARGDRDRVIASYLATGPEAALPDRWIDVSRAPRYGRGSGEVRFEALRLRGPDDVAAGHPRPDGPLTATIVVDASSPHLLTSLAITFYDRFGTKLINADSIAKGVTIALRAGRNEVCVRIESLHLNPGTYTVGLWAADAGRVHDHIDNCSLVEVVDVGDEGCGRRPARDGLVTCEFETRAACPAP